jgi:voltage-gated potassium channel
MNIAPDATLRRERWKLTVRLVRVLERPKLLLCAVWSVRHHRVHSGGSAWLQTLSDIIWAAFVVQFLIEFVTAPHEGVYLRNCWVTALSLAVPVIRLPRLSRVIRLVRMARATRGIRLVRLLGPATIIAAS